MKFEGRVVGCEACRELKKKEIQRREEERKRELLESATVTKQVEKKKTNSYLDIRKSSARKKKLLPGGRMEGEPEWWGVGVNRVISVGPGDMYVEDVELDICVRTYTARIAKAVQDRGSWAEFMKLMRKKYIEAMTKSLGPDWFQDLSPRQTGLIDKLPEIIEADMQEGITSRTGRALKEIGVYPPIPKDEIETAMHACLGSNIRFLFLLHKVVVEREQGTFDREFNEAVEEGNAVQTYSINERLLLSGVFHLHFDEFTNKLDKLLPPPPEKPKLVLPKRAPPEPKKKYRSPYLEPLPLPPKVWFEQRVEDDLYAEQARLVLLQEKKEFEQKVLKEAEEQKKAKEEKLRRLLEHKNYFGNSRSLKRTLESVFEQEANIPQRENKSKVFRRFSLAKKTDKVEKKSDKNATSRTSKSSSKSSLNISKSVQHVRRNRRYMYDVIHQTLQTKTSYGGFFAHDNKLLKDTEGANLKIRLVPRNEKVVCLYRDEEFKPVQVLDTRVRICCRDVGVQTDAEPMFLSVNLNPEAEFYKIMDRIKPASDAFTNTEDITEEEIDLQTRQTVESARKMSLPVPDDEEKPTTVECTDELCALVDYDVPVDEYVIMRQKISMYSPEKQLKAAVAFLCRRGDPLAILPRVEETPWLLRWFELRRGVKEKLTAEEKEELMHISKRLWLTSYRNVSQTVAKPFKVRKKVTTLDRDWLMQKIDKFKTDFQTKMRRQLVNNAREYFPTFFTEYFNSPLNKSFAKTFFTYMSAKEMDAYVFKVWAMESKDMTKKNEGNAN